MLNRILRVCATPVHLKRTASIASVVGTWLTLVNQGDLLLAGQSPIPWSKLVLNYLTPFVVSNLGLLSADTESAS